MTAETLGDYELERLLGRGTMGLVYLAHRIGNPNERVAIKRVHAMASAQDRERLRRETVTMSVLDHPNVMPVLEVIDGADTTDASGLADQADLAFVMPYAPLGTLSDGLATCGPMAPHEVRTAITAVADALAAAHARGIVHRDVKPSNILFDGNGPLLADFGIARNAAQTNLTRTNFALGTAAYLDPEVADGAEPSEASDQYALGVVAYEALTGSPPFTATSPLGVLKAADRAMYEPLHRDVFGDLGPIVERAFARRRSDRWPDVAAFADALRNATLDEHHGLHRAAPGAHTAAGVGTDRTAGLAPAAPPAPGTPLTDGPLTDGSDGPDGSNGPDMPVTDGTGDRGDAGPEPHAPEWHDATTTFRRTNAAPKAIDDAAPIERPRRRLLAAGVAAVLGMAGAGAFTALRSRPSTLRPLPVAELPTCAPETSAQCVGSYARTPTGVKVTFAGGAESEFRFGRSSDAVRVANFFCGERATAALYRPDDGLVFYLTNWPDPESDEPSEVRVDATGITGASVAVGDTDRDGCADLALDAGTTRTWFLPSEQTGRLQRGTLSITTKDPS